MSEIIVVTSGKGGVGKTTFAATLATIVCTGRQACSCCRRRSGCKSWTGTWIFRRRSGFNRADHQDAKADSGTYRCDDQNQFYKLNPKVDDIPDAYSKTCNGVKLLVLGTVETGGGGCVCPEHVMLKRVINNLVIHRDDVVIMDMEAGLEHLGRGTTEGVDAFVVVIEPGARSVQTYKNVKRLAKDLGVSQVKVVANKVRNEDDENFIRERIPQEDLLGMIHYNTEVIDADRQGKSPL